MRKNIANVNGSTVGRKLETITKLPTVTRELEFADNSTVYVHSATGLGAYIYICIDNACMYLLKFSLSGEIKINCIENQQN